MSLNHYQGFNFQEIMRQTEMQMRQDHQAFAFAPDNPYKLVVLNPEGIMNRALTALEQTTLQRIQEVDAYSWNRGSLGGLQTGFDLFDEGIEGGVQPGLYVLAAAPNVGKSAFMLQLGKQIAERNANAFVVYFSLDDSLKELMPRYVACDQNITIAQAKNPERFMDQPEVLVRRNEGFKNLYRRMNQFMMLDSSDGESVEFFESKIKELKIMLPDDTKLVVMIDSYNDTKVSSKDFGDNTKAKYEHTAKEIKSWVTAYDVSVFCTAHLRKNGSKRPINDDLKETNTLEYEANWIGMLYNEVGVKESNAEVYWLSEEDDDKKPVIEVRFAKNKLGSYKGTRFYEFLPDQSYCVEASIESCRRYASLIYN